MKFLNSWELVLLSIFMLASVATFGSLFFSEVMLLPPCDLCWSQRIFMYPLTILSLTGLYLRTKLTFYFLLPLVLPGTLIAIYHNLLYYNFIENIIPCSLGVSCTSRQLLWFGFLTIPLMSLISFSLIVFLVFRGLILIRRSSNE